MAAHKHDTYILFLCICEKTSYVSFFVPLWFLHKAHFIIPWSFVICGKNVLYVKILKWKMHNGKKWMGNKKKDFSLLSEFNAEKMWRRRIRTHNTHFNIDISTFLCVYGYSSTFEAYKRHIKFSPKV